MSSFQQEIAQFEMALAAAQVAENLSGAADILCRLGELYESCDYGQQAVDCYQQAVTIAREIGDPHLEYQYLAKVGQTHDWMGQRIQAVECFEKARAIAQALDEPNSELYCLHMIEMLYEKQGDYRKALDYLEQAQNIYEKEFPNMETYLQRRIIDLRRKIDADGTNLND